MRGGRRGKGQRLSQQAVVDGRQQRSDSNVRAACPARVLVVEAVVLILMIGLRGALDASEEVSHLDHDLTNDHKLDVEADGDAVKEAASRP